jgi:hypothetical protein
MKVFTYRVRMAINPTRKVLKETVSSVSNTPAANYCILLYSAQVAGSCECGNEPLGSIKRGEFID